MSSLNQIVLGLGLALLVVLGLEGAQGDLMIDFGDGEMRRVSINDDGSLRITLRSDSERMKVKSRGPIRLADDERSVASLQPGGWLEVDHRTFDGFRHRLQVKPKTGGGITHEYSLDGEVKPFEGEAREWFHGMALMLYRRVGLEADDRAQRIWEAGGLAGLLQEVDHISSDSIKALYLGAGLASAEISSDERVALLEASVDLDSDYRLASLLSKIETSSLREPEVLRAFSESARGLESDFRLSEVLTHHLKGVEALSPLPAVGLNTPVAVSLGEPDSSATNADAEEELGAQGSKGPEALENSPEALEAAQGDATPEAAKEAIRAALFSLAARLESDHYLAGVLTTHAELRDAAQGLSPKIYRPLGSIEGDHYRALAIMALAGAVPVEDLSALVEAGGRIESDHHRSQVLIWIVELQPTMARSQDTELHGALLKSMLGLESDYYRDQVGEYLRSDTLQGAI